MDAILRKRKHYKKALSTEFTIINKDKQEVPFVVNQAQGDFLDRMTERNIILKARKMGFSSLLLGLACLKFIYGTNEKCVSMSFDQTAAQKQLERAKHYLRSFEQQFKIKLPLKYNSKSEMVYERQHPKTGQISVNALRIGTAKSGSFGRGDDITFLHITEVSLCDNLEELLAGVGQAVVNDSIITLETTANGFNPFKTFWDASELGETSFQPLFYSPEWEYSKDFLALKKKELGRLFPQEYPMTAQEAFLTSGDSYFDLLALKAHLEAAKLHERSMSQTDPLTALQSQPHANTGYF